MILSVVATTLIALLAMAPGWIMMRGRVTGPGMVSAAMAASLSVVMLVTALIGIGAFAVAGIALPALSMVPVSIAGLVLAWQFQRGQSNVRSGFEWQGIVFGCVFLAYGFFVQSIAVRIGSDGTLMVHGWFNADWFKHLGHVSAIANFGIPARDNFNQADLLHYYWMSYILPSSGVAIGQHAWSALIAANSVLVMAFGSIFYGILRKAGMTPWTALFIGLVALFASAPISFVYQAFFGIGLEGILNYPAAPKGPALLALSQYVPQHLLAIIALLGWFLLKDDRHLRWLALAGLVPAMAVSVLLGALALLAYGIYRLWTGRVRAIPELAAMVILSGLLVVVFQVVQIGNVDSAIESPLLTNEGPDLPIVQRVVDGVYQLVGNVGLPFLIAILGLYYWKPEEPDAQQSKVFAVALIVASVLGVIGAEVALTERLSIETWIRAVNLPGIANAIVCGMLFQAAWHANNEKRLMAAATLALVVIVAMPSTILRTAWHGRMGDAFTTLIPRDDLRLLATMRERTERSSIVLQFPEPPLLAQDRGDDAWAAILGQRAVTASLRATDYPAAAPRIASAERFFSGEDEAISEKITLVYLSRALHPETYDRLLQRMDSEPSFTRLDCYADACLFQRRENISQ